LFMGWSFETDWDSVVDAENSRRIPAVGSWMVLT
jgi:hypothetical protein